MGAWYVVFTLIPACFTGEVYRLRSCISVINLGILKLSCQWWHVHTCCRCHQVCRRKRGGKRRRWSSFRCPARPVRLLGWSPEIKPLQHALRLAAADYMREASCHVVTAVVWWYGTCIYTKGYSCVLGPAGSSWGVNLLKFTHTKITSQMCWPNTLSWLTGKIRELLQCFRTLCLICIHDDY